jgi:hypothetical protein
MPFDCAVNIMDCFFYDGAKVIFQVALSILDNLQQDLILCKDDGEAITTVSQYLDTIGNSSTTLYSNKPLKQWSLDIVDLIYESYSKFGDKISNQDISKLRLKHRLKVVQTLEDGTMKNVLRSVSSDSLIVGKELEQLFIVFKEEYLTACYWRANQPPTDVFDKYDPAKPYYEQYKVDFDQFKILCNALSPWASCQHCDLLALRMFRLLDTNHDNMVNFRDFIWLLSVLCRAEMQERLKLLYRLHQPPALLDSELTDVESPSNQSDTTDSAIEAVEYFDEHILHCSSSATPTTEQSSLYISTEQPTESLVQESESSLLQQEPAVSLVQESASPVLSLIQEPESSVRKQEPAASLVQEHESPVLEQESAKLVVQEPELSVLTQEPTGSTIIVQDTTEVFPAETSSVTCTSDDSSTTDDRRTGRRNRYKNLPAMNQGQFIQMCKTLYDLFTDEPNEQQLFHSIATVATLLLQIGEVGKQFYSATAAAGDSCSKLDQSSATHRPQSLPVVSSGVRSLLDTDWSITFEQFLASMLTETPLVNYFERHIDLLPAIERFRNRRLQRQISTSPATTV